MFRLFVLLMLLALPARAADYAALNGAAVRHHIQPGYERLAAATGKLTEAARASCSDLKTLQAAWSDAMAAWQGVQHLRFGPIELFNRLQRFNFWPDPRNVAARQLAELFQRADPAALAPETFVMGSVATQGLSAIERVLFDSEETAKLTPGSYRCQWLVAVTVNLAEMARAADADWRGPPVDYARRFVEAAPGDLHYHDAREATGDLFKSLYTAVELVADHKLARPLGERLDRARPRLAEGWRSGTSLAHLRTNLAAAQSLYEALARDVDPAVDAELRRRFAATRAAADAIPGTLEVAVADKTNRAGVERLRREAVQLKGVLADKLTEALGLPLGFNALDGD